ncbi:hypothetical protein [Nonomuraea sp. NPDC049725]|uniref:hypothetical protein n=1 Tax=Nonomuraea sp. NPDC049725 TaxID=3154508 RepID=UPI0034270DD8
MTTQLSGGFIGDLNDAFAPAAAGGCCGSTAAATETAACCGNAPADAQDGPSDSSTGCCG